MLLNSQIAPRNNKLVNYERFCSQKYNNTRETCFYFYLFLIFFIFCSFEEKHLEAMLAPRAILISTSVENIKFSPPTSKPGIKISRAQIVVDQRRADVL